MRHTALNTTRTTFCLWTSSFARKRLQQSYNNRKNHALCPDQPQQSPPAPWFALGLDGSTVSRGRPGAVFASSDGLSRIFCTTSSNTCRTPTLVFALEIHDNEAKQGVAQNGLAILCKRWGVTICEAGVTEWTRQEGGKTLLSEAAGWSSK